MKRLFALFIIIIVTVASQAQVQPGYVKSIGRPDAPGKPLEGVLLRAKGAHNHIISAADGTFSLPLPEIKPGEAYSLQQIRKNGYELCEQSTIGRSYAFSDSVPLAITMLSTAQLQADKQRIEENAYRAAEKNYKKQLAALEHSKENNLITIEEYRAQMQALVDGFEKYQNLIETLSDHYARADYDNLDSTEREINLCIEQGELDRADSLLHTIFDPAEFIARNQAKLEQLNTTIDQAQTMLTQANADLAAVLRRQEKDAEYLYHLYTISLARFDNEKARFYIETRAELDTTNYRWQSQAAFYLRQQNKYNEAEFYYNKALAICRESTSDKPFMIGLLVSIAEIYHKTQRFAECEAMHKTAIEICQKQNKDSTSCNESLLATVFNGLAMLYSDTQRFAESEEFYKKALENWRRIANLNQYYKIEIVRTLNNLAILYSYMQRFTESEDLLKETLDISLKLAEENPRMYEEDLATIYSSLAILYFKVQRFIESEAMYKNCLELYDRLAKNNPQRYNPDLATTYNNLAVLYEETQRFAESEVMYKEALEIHRRLAKEYPQVYEPELAMSLNNLALFYDYAQRFAESETMSKDALEIYRKLVYLNPQVYEPQLAKSLNNLALLYHNTQRFAESEATFKEVLEIRRRLAIENPQVYEPELARTLNNIGAFYFNNRNYTECEAALKEVLEIHRKLATDNPQTYEPELAKTLNNLAQLYDKTQLFTADGRTEYQEALEIYHRLAAKEPEIYETKIAKILYPLALLAAQNGDIDYAITSFEKIVSILEQYRRNDIEHFLYTSTLNLLIQAYNNDFHKKFIIYDKLVSLRRNEYNTNPLKNKTKFIELLYNYLVDCTYAKDFVKVEELARELLNVDQSQTFIYPYLAPALLFQGKYAEAEEIFSTYKAELKKEFLENFEQFEEAGIIPDERREDVEKIRTMLNE